MNESIKDRFMKDRALNDNELKKVAGGMIGHISCSNPNCKYYRSCFIVAAGQYCEECGSEMVWVSEGFYVPD